MANEYGALSFSEDGVQSRGDVEQKPVLLEVHQFNPEQRFVLVPEGSDGSGSKDEGLDAERRPSERPTPKTPTSRFEFVSGGEESPGTERRLCGHKDRSAVASRPEARQTRRPRDKMLSSNVIIGATGRQSSDCYYGHSTFGRPSSNKVDGHRRQTRGSLSPQNGARSESTPHARGYNGRRLHDESYRSYAGGTSTFQASKSLRPRGPRHGTESSKDQCAYNRSSDGRRHTTTVPQALPPRVPESDNSFQHTRTSSQCASTIPHEPTPESYEHTPVTESPSLRVSSHSVPERNLSSADPKDLVEDGFQCLNEGEARALKFPECPRVKPTRGKMDWLSLPYTDFNICPDCFQGVFLNSGYETQFQPILRPSYRHISCDFGSSPWYRIAYLLTLEGESPCLQLLHQVDAAMTTADSQPCPGARKVVRHWYGIHDPRKERAVPNFTACLQCVSIVEVLLPNLRGRFVPIHSQSAEQFDSVCSLHFEPRRRFVQYFDTLCYIADDAVHKGQLPDIHILASEVQHLSELEECHEDTPMLNAH